MDRRVTRLSGLPHLPGVHHLHVNRPLFLYRRRNLGFLSFIQTTMLFLSFLFLSFFVHDISFLLFVFIAVVGCLFLITAISFESSSTSLQVSVELTNA